MFNFKEIYYLSLTTIEIGNNQGTVERGQAKHISSFQLSLSNFAIFNMVPQVKRSL